MTGFDQHEVDALVASFAESGHEYELPGSEPYINNFFDSGVQAKPKAEEPAPAEDAADSTDSAESTDTADTTEPAADADTEQLPLTHPDRMTANEEENPM